MRALGSSVGGALNRAGVVLGPIAVGAVYAGGGMETVFLTLPVVSLTGAVVAGLGAEETAGRRLEEVSPWPGASHQAGSGTGGLRPVRSRPVAAQGPPSAPSQVRAATTSALIPVSSVGWITGAKAAEWLTGTSCRTVPRSSAAR